MKKTSSKKKTKSKAPDPPLMVRRVVHDQSAQKIILCRETPQIPSPAAYVYGFTVRTIAELMGWTVNTAEIRIQEGVVDPSSLESICENWMRVKQARGYESMFGERKPKKITFGGETFSFDVR